MTTPFERLADLDRIVHEPARLAMLSALSACADADFVYLKRLTGVTHDNLGAHLSRLAESELFVITKEFVGRIPRTTVRLTDVGRQRIEMYWRDLDRLSQAAKGWRPGLDGRAPT